MWAQEVFARVSGRINGSKKFAFSRFDIAHIALTALWVGLAAMMNYFLTLVPHLPEGAPAGLSIVLTALLQAGSKFFSDTRNVPVVGSDEAIKLSSRGAVAPFNREPLK